MHSRSPPSAAPSEDRISDRLLDGSALTRRPVRPCSRVSWLRAEESASWPDSRAITSSGCTSAALTSATTRPCRSTTIRSASRNIMSMSWQASTTDVPCSRAPAISSSTCFDMATPRAAVGSSSSRSRGRHAIARPTATSCRCPPDSDLMSRVVAGRRMPRPSSSRLASVCSFTSETSCRRRSRPSMRFAAMSRFSHRARSCHSTLTPCLASVPGSDWIGAPPILISPPAGAISPPMQRTSVVFPAPFSPARATISPSPTARLTPLSASTGPKLTLRSVTSSSAGACSRWLRGAGGAVMSTFCALRLIGHQF